MHDPAKSYAELLEENAALRKKISEYEQDAPIRSDVASVVADHIPTLLACLDTDLRFVYVNQAYAAWYGRSREDIVGNRLSDILDDEAYQHALPYCRQTLQGQTVAFENRIVNIEGRERIVSAGYVPRRQDKQVIGIIATLMDITEQRQAEEALRMSEKKFSQVFQLSPSAIGITRLSDAVYVDANESLCRELGATRDEIIGRSALDLNFWPDPAQREAYRREVVTSGVVHNREQRMRMATGDLRWVLMSAVPITVAGEPCILTQSLDITERKRIHEILQESESRLKVISNNIPSAMVYQVIVRHDGTKQFTYVSDSVWKLHGITPEQAIADPMLIYGAVHPDDVPRFIRIEEEALKAGSTFKIDVRVKDPARGFRWSTLASTPMILEDGSTCWNGIELDITERKQADEELQKMSAIVQNSQEFINLASPDGRFVFLNGEGCRMLGIDRDNVGHWKIFDVIPDHLLSLVQEEIFPALSRGNAWQGNMQYRNVTTGMVTDVFAMTFPILDPVTNTLRYYGNISHDITEQKLAEEAIRQNQENFRRFLDGAPLGARIVTATGRTIYANRALLDIYGFKGMEEFKSTTAKDFYTPESYADHLARREKRQQGAFQPSEYDISIVRKDGEVRHLRVFRKDIIWSGQPQFQVLYHDITAQKQAERDIQNLNEDLRLRVSELRETRDYLENLIDYANAPIIVWDPDFRITVFNNAFEKLTGRTSAEVIGCHLELLFPETSRSDSLQHISEALSGQRWQSLEIPIEHKDGTVCTVLWNSATLYRPDDGTVLATIAQGQDISKRKLAEEQSRRQERLLAAINRVLLETLTADTEEDVAQVCLAVAQQITDSKFGFIGEITPEGRFTITALSDPDWKACRMAKENSAEMITDMAIRGIWGQVILQEQSLIVNDPSAFPNCVGIPAVPPPLTSFIGIPLRDHGRVVGMIALANNEWGYTESHQQDLEALIATFVEAMRRKQAEGEIGKLNEELEQRVEERTAQLEVSNRELESFSYSVSHDLRAPLRSINGFSRSLLEDYAAQLDDQGKDYLNRVCRAARHMDLLIDDLLKLSRVARVDFQRNKVDLSALVRDVAETCRQNNPQQAVDLIIQERVVVRGDSHLLRIAVTNLLDNAWKFTGRTAHPRIEFGVTVKEGKDVYYVRDNGAGFDMTYAGKLFGAFQRLHSAEEFPGTGVGLATVKRIINRHGGQVWVESEVAKGTTFYFTL